MKIKFEVLHRTEFFPGNSNIYEVNIRQYTQEGSFRAFAAHIPRLSSMGVEILWLMPIYPIGEKNRKGSLGSYYAISDFKAINPEFGDAGDLKYLIEEIHRHGMKVILDWVANHAAWDNIWTIDHPEYFVSNEQGVFLSPYDWTDVIQIDHGCKEERIAMMHAMKYWVTEFDIDGFRADLAHLTPLEFWMEARNLLDQEKRGLIWLAETEDPEYHRAFDISFTWEWMHALEKRCKQEIAPSELIRILKNYRENFPPQSLRLFFTSNHDENSWNGTEYEKYGLYAKAAAVFSCLYGSVPLLYSGQEIPNRNRISFFEKDSLDWTGGVELQGFYKTLYGIRKKHPALWNNNTSHMPDVFMIEGEVMAFFRKESEDLVFSALNFGNGHVCTQFIHAWLHGQFIDVFNGQIIQLKGDVELNLEPGGFLVLTRD